MAKIPGAVDRAIANILRSLTFRDNFFQWEWEGAIAATTEISINHPLNIIPTGMLVLRAHVGPIVAGAAAWTKTTISVKNLSATPETAARIIFLG